MNAPEGVAPAQGRQLATRRSRFHLVGATVVVQYSDGAYTGRVVRLVNANRSKYRVEFTDGIEDVYLPQEKETHEIIEDGWYRLEVSQ